MRINDALQPETTSTATEFADTPVPTAHVPDCNRLGEAPVGKQSSQIEHGVGERYSDSARQSAEGRQIVSVSHNTNVKCKVSAKHSASVYNTESG